MFLINFNQWKCACVGINNLEIFMKSDIGSFYYNLPQNSKFCKNWTDTHAHMGHFILRC